MVQGTCSVIRRLIRMSALRYAIQFSALFIVIMIAAGFVLSLELSRQTHQEIDASLESRVADILTRTTENDRTVTWFNKLQNNKHGGSTESFLTNDGQIIGSASIAAFAQEGYRTLNSEELFGERYVTSSEHEFSPHALDGLHADHTLEEELAETRSWRIYVQPIDSGKIAVYTSIHEVEDALELLPTIMLPITFVVVLTTIFGGCVLGLRQQARVKQIHDALGLIAAGDLSQRLAPLRQKDDIDELMVGIDGATEKLETSVRQLTDFSRNVAHELRTPLTELRAALEVAEGTSDLTIAIEKTNGLIRTFDAVQRISRLGRPGSATHFETIPLNNILKLLEDIYAESVAENQQTLSVESSTDRTIRGDLQLLAQMGSNLIENAMRYAGPGAVITIGASDNQLFVKDTGIGIPGRDFDKVLEPFYKRDTARNSAGTGLGLALVKAIAGYHNAQLELSETLGGGLTVIIRFPDQGL